MADDTKDFNQNEYLMPVSFSIQHQIFRIRIPPVTGSHRQLVFPSGRNE